MDGGHHAARVGGAEQGNPAMHHDLPRPTRDLDRLKADMDTWGYCLAADALEGGVLETVRERLLAQAAAEREHGIARQDSPVEVGEQVNQWVRMLSNKGRIFIDALVHNPVTRPVVHHLLGKEVLLSGLDSHITWPGNGAMGLHIDQWWLPHPVMPGSHLQVVFQKAICPSSNKRIA